MSTTDVHSQVQTHYGNAALDTSDGTYGQRVAKEFGYSKEELANVPAEANLGLSCGNPFALANLKEGETVIDLGSGAGFDVFQAAKKVGPSGRAIGIDQNEAMLNRANTIKSKLSAPPSTSDTSNISFILSSITHLNLSDSMADCIISNCVINLVPETDKQLVFAEMFRVLKPGGRVAVSDILAKGDIPQRVRKSMAMFVGCFAGASPVSAYEKYLKEAGFEDVLIVDSKSDLNVYRQDDGANLGCCAPSQATAVTPETSSTTTGCCGSTTKASSRPAQAETVADFADVDFNAFAGSYKIYAVKPL